MYVCKHLLLSSLLVLFLAACNSPVENGGEILLGGEGEDDNFDRVVVIPPISTTTTRPITSSTVTSSSTTSPTVTTSSTTTTRPVATTSSTTTTRPVATTRSTTTTRPVATASSTTTTQPTHEPMPPTSIPPIRWRTDLPVGRELGGMYVGGTEIRSLEAFDGKLFAGNSYWLDRDENLAYLPGAQILVKESAKGPWKVDLHLAERLYSDARTPNPRRFFSISALKAVTFRFDGEGNRLPEPVSLLLASVWDRKAEKGVTIFSRETSGKWTETELFPSNGGASKEHIRSIQQYRDSVTGAEYVFVGTSGRPGNPTAILRGVYDPKRPGKLAWVNVSEPMTPPPSPGDRVTSFAEMDGVLYASSCNKIYQREDGTRPKWNRIYVNSEGGCPDVAEGEWGYRGITPIKKGNEWSLLLGSEGLGIIHRLIPGRSPTVDFNIKRAAAIAFKRDDIGYIISAYNDMAPIKLPGGWVALGIGIQTMTNLGGAGTYLRKIPGAWWILRVHATDHRMRIIEDTSIPAAQRPPLSAVRTMIQSPFNGEAHVIYAGGFDAGDVYTPHVPKHESAWLYRGEFE